MDLAPAPARLKRDLVAQAVAENVALIEGRRPSRPRKTLRRSSLFAAFTLGVALAAIAWLIAFAARGPAASAQAATSPGSALVTSPVDPPPMAVPLSAQTHGLPHVSMRR